MASVTIDKTQIAAGDNFIDRSDFLTAFNSVEDIIEDILDGTTAFDTFPTTASQTANRVFASPNGSPGAGSFRALVNQDLPQSPTFTGNLQAATVTSTGNTVIGANLDHNGTNVGFFGATPAAKPTVSGTRDANPGLASLLSGLASLGLVADTTTAGSPAGGGAALTTITNWTELGSSAASISLSSIPQTHKHLRLYTRLRTDASGATDNVTYAFNSSTNTHYYGYEALLYQTSGSSRSLGVEVLGTQSSFQFNAAAAATTPSGIFAHMEMTILDYTSTTRKKTVLVHGNLIGNITANNLYVQNFIGIYNTTGAISNITLTPGAGSNFIAGSAYALYGVE